MTYTFITNFRGGTYIEQVEGADVLSATHQWGERTARNAEIEHLDTTTFLSAFEAEIEEYPPMRIEGCPNVWFLSYFSGRNRMEVHIVKTSAEKEPAGKKAKIARPVPAFA